MAEPNLVGAVVRAVVARRGANIGSSECQAGLEEGWPPLCRRRVSPIARAGNSITNRPSSSWMCGSLRHVSASHHISMRVGSAHTPGYVLASVHPNPSTECKFPVVATKIRTCTRRANQKQTKIQYEQACSGHGRPTRRAVLRTCV